MTPRERADRARQLLGDTVFIDAMRDIRERIVSKLETVNADDHGAQHELVLSLQILQRIPARFQAYADELVIEKHHEQQESFMKRLKQRVTRA